jgi:hypothetical protein
MLSCTRCDHTPHCLVTSSPHNEAPSDQEVGRVRLQSYPPGDEIRIDLAESNRSHDLTIAYGSAVTPPTLSVLAAKALNGWADTRIT